MTVKYIYTAYDGREFDSLAKCAEYEDRAMSLMNEFNRHVLLLDMMKRPIICPTGANIEGTMTWFHQAYGNCVYMNINVKLSDELIAFIDNDLGLIIPPNKVGLYMYDYNDDEWVSADWPIKYIRCLTSNILP